MRKKRIENFERFQKEEKENNKLERLLREQVNNLRKVGVPVNENLRIDMKKFKDILSEERVNEDIKTLKEVKRNQYKRELTLEEIEKIEKERKGEKGEIFVCLLLQKFLGDNFLVLRTSLYDDRVNKVDLFVVNKKTGNIDFTIDVSVNPPFSLSLFEKQKRLLERNTSSGTLLTYGIKFEKGKAQPSSYVKYLPLFSINLPPRILEKGINSITSLKEKAPQEKAIFDRFKTQIEEQINQIKEKCFTENKRPHPNLERKLTQVEELIKWELSLNLE